MAQTFSATFLNMASIPVPILAETSLQIIWFSRAKSRERCCSTRYYSMGRSHLLPARAIMKPS